MFEGERDMGNGTNEAVLVLGSGAAVHNVKGYAVMSLLLRFYQRFKKTRELASE